MTCIENNSMALTPSGGYKLCVLYCPSKTNLIERTSYSTSSCLQINFKRSPRWGWLGPRRLDVMHLFLTGHPPLDSPQKKNQKTVSGDPKNYHLGCLGYPKEHQTKSFQGKISKKVTFYAKIKHFLAYLTLFLFVSLP